MLERVDGLDGAKGARRPVQTARALPKLVGFGADHKDGEVAESGGRARGAGLRGRAGVAVARLD